MKKESKVKSWLELSNHEQRKVIEFMSKHKKAHKGIGITILLLFILLIVNIICLYTINNIIFIYSTIINCILLGIFVIYLYHEVKVYYNKNKYNIYKQIK